MNFIELIERADELAEEMLEGAKEARAEAFGLDSRAASKLWAGEGFIAVLRSEDRSLQYYGGFEYVDSGFRTELSWYVFYSAEDSRVAEHLNRVLDRDEPSEEE